MAKIKLDKEYLKRLCKLTAPISFQTLMLALVAASDSFMLGKLSQEAMSAVSLATEIQFVQNMFIFAITGASIILGSQYAGKGDRAAVRDIFCLILRISGVISIVFCVACEICPSLLMSFFTSEQSLIQLGADYLRIAGWSYLLTGITQCYITVLKFTGKEKAGAAISAGAVILNIALNAIFIFGLCGMPSMGVRGAALATTVSRICEIIAVIAYSFRPGCIRPTVRGLFRRNRLLSRDYFKNLLPLTGASLLWGFGLTFYTSVIGHYDTDVTAANAVCVVVRELMCSACDGICNAGGIIVGSELGKGDTEKGRDYGNKTAVVAFGVAIISCLLVWAVSPLALSFVSLNERATELLRDMMLILGVYMIGRSINSILINGIFASGGDNLFDVYSLILCQWCISMPLSYLAAFVFDFPPQAVYLFTCFDEIVKTPWVFIHFKKYKWVKDLTRDNIAE